MLSISEMPYLFYLLGSSRNLYTLTNTVINLSCVHYQESPNRIVYLSFITLLQHRGRKGIFILIIIIITTVIVIIIIIIIIAARVALIALSRLNYKNAAL